jgi:hypothetical protein
MNNQFYVVVYSKFSKHCKKFMDTLNKLNIGLNINYLSVDNPTSRNRILSNKKLNIKNVPCILAVFPETGNVDVYEGNDSFIWLNEQQQKILEEQKRLQIQQMQQQLQQQQLQQQQQQKQIELQHQQQLKQKKKQKYEDQEDDEPVVETRRKQRKTLIDDLDSENEEEIEEENEQQSSIPVPSYPTKKRSEHTKRDSLLSTALQMQKSRETEDKSLKKTNNNRM